MVPYDGYFRGAFAIFFGDRAALYLVVVLEFCNDLPEFSTGDLTMAPASATINGLSLPASAESCCCTAVNL